MLHKREPYLPYEMQNLSDFLNNIKGEVISVLPNVDYTFFGMAKGVNYLFIIEKTVPNKDTET
jgi:hypothetical protein